MHQLQNRGNQAAKWVKKTEMAPDTFRNIHTHLQMQTNTRVSLRRYAASATNNDNSLNILNSLTKINNQTGQG